MANYGFDFRQTSAYVTDPAGNTYSIADAYPQTRNGITFGWLSAPSGRDRSTSVNPRVAGMNFTAAASPKTFQITLPASGTYQIGCAMGDAISIQGVQYIEIFDNTTSLYSMTSAAGPGVNQYYDINGNLWTSDSAWFTNQTFQTLTFSTTTLKITIGKSGVGSNHALAHIDVNQTGGTNVNLTAATATGAVGSFVPSLGVPATGVAAAGAIGGFAPTLGAALSGVAAVAAVGAFGATLPAPLIGVAASGAAAGFAPVLLVPLGGVFGLGAVGALLPPGAVDVALSGVSATGAAADLTAALNAALAAVSASGAAAGFLPTEPFPLTDVFASGAVAPLLPAGGTIALGGVLAIGAAGSLLADIISFPPPNGRWRAVSSISYRFGLNTVTDLTPRLNEGGFTIFFDLPLNRPPPQNWSLVFTAPSGRSFVTRAVFWGQDPVGGYLIPQRTYLAHTTGTHELDETGIWSVAAASGAILSEPGYFTVTR